MITSKKPRKVSYLKRRKPLSRISKWQKDRLAVYKKDKAWFLMTHPMCEACRQIYGTLPRKSVDVHHRHGRAGSLLCDMRFWTAVCRFCHDWIHRNIEAARLRGLIAQRGEWNRVPR